MELVDVKKLETAILYVQRIADGRNPVNNTLASEDAVLNNPNVVRCMSFVKEVLEEVRRNDGYIGRKAKKTGTEPFPIDNLSGFVFKEDKSITKLVGQMNEMADLNVYKGLSYKPIIGWLKENGFLCEEQKEGFSQKITIPTVKGMQIGIRAERRRGNDGKDYMYIIYGKSAQEYIVNHMKHILANELEQ
ncbi:MAG: hypothetical protein IJ794_10965 [Lachnospiraceae bacterium]|nr:hypothetical protein [Lachnospiraceae bacterium]